MTPPRHKVPLRTLCRIGQTYQSLARLINDHIA
nr:MAG TPA: hypothetical protein [Caudoviricetes sp.]DAV63844.1 MAG TPA: hypothetical protein [Caudoviricetes sp.]